jgi:hypothetical protein
MAQRDSSSRRRSYLIEERAIMAIFAISFRIHEDSTYEERYESLIEQIKKEAIDATWEETTSFFIIESNETASKSLCDRLYNRSDILESKDILLVINLSAKGYAQRGAQYPNTLDSLMRKR